MSRQDWQSSRFAVPGPGAVARLLTSVADASQCHKTKSLATRCERRSIGEARDGSLRARSRTDAAPSSRGPQPRH